MKATLNLNAARRSLEAERGMLTERIAELTRALAAPEASAADVLDTAETEAERLVQAALLAQSQHQLQQVEAALQQLAEGHYGICTVCKGTISPERLALLPYTVTCVTCQKQQEHTSGQQLRRA